MTKQEIEMILSRYETAKKRIEYLEGVLSLDLRDTARTIEMSLSDISVLLDALDEKDAEIEKLKAERDGLTEQIKVYDAYLAGIGHLEKFKKILSKSNL